MNKKLPNFKDSLGRTLVPISEASKILGVSLDTLRRWDKQGKISSRRPDGKNRYFLVEDLENFKTTKNLSISEAAEMLGISQTTLRRLDDRGVVPASREAGERVYQLPELEEFMSSQYFQTKKYIEKTEFDALGNLQKQIQDRGDEQLNRLASTLVEEDEEIHELFGFKKRLFQTAALCLLIGFVTVAGLTFSFLKFPESTAKFMGYKDSAGNRLFAAPNISTIKFIPAQPNSKVLGAKSTEISDTGSKNLLRSALVPFTRVSLALVEKINPKTYEEVLPKSINEVFGINKNNQIVPALPIALPSSSYLLVPDRKLIKNLNADYLRGRVPGSGKGNIAYFSSTGVINGLDLSSFTTTSGPVDLSSSDVFGILGLAKGGTGADLSGGSPGGLLYMSSGKLAITSALSGILVGNGGNAPSAAAGTENVIVKWGANGKTLSDSLIYDNGTNVGIGNTNPDQKLEVSGNIYARGGQIRIGNFDTQPTAIGAGSLYYDTVTTQIYYYNGTSWQVIGSGGGGGDSIWELGNGAIFPLNSTVDALIGGQSTASAKFGFINVNSGTPNIQINGVNVLNPTTLGSGVVNSSLTGVGALVSGSIGSGFGTIATANTISGTTLNGTTGINTGAGAGTQRIDASGNLVNIGTLTAAGTITFSSFTSNGGPLYTNGSGQLAQVTAGTSSQCLLGGTTPTFGSCQTGGISNDVFWNQANGALFPNNSTVDLLVGGQSSTAAKFAILGVNGTRGTQTASLSGSLVLDSSTASIQTTNNQALAIGGNKTGTINISPNNGTGQTNINGTLDVSGHMALGANTGVLARSVLSLEETLNPVTDEHYHGVRSRINASLPFTGTVDALWAGSFRVESSATTGIQDWLGGVEASAITSGGAGSTVTQVHGLYAYVANQGDQTIGTAYGARVAPATNTGAGAITNNYGLYVQAQTAGVSDYGVAIGAADTQTLWISNNANNTTAAAGIAFGLSRDTNLYRSAADTLKTDDSFVIGTNLTISTLTSNGGVLYTNGSGLVSEATAGTSSQCLLGGTNPSFGSCQTGFSDPYWNQANGSLFANNSTVDLLVGGQSTTSAKFAVLNVNGARGTQTASISGSLVLDSAGSLQTTNEQLLTLGGSTTGNINLQPLGTSTSGLVLIGSAGAGGVANPDFLVVDQASGALPTAVNGAIAVDSTGKFSIYEGGAWKVLCNKTDAACGAGSGSALSNISAALGANTISNGDFAQAWNWQMTTNNSTAFTFGESVASTGTGSTILKVATVANSTASPLQVIAQGNTVINVANTGGITLGSSSGVGNVLVSANAGGQAALIVDKLGSNDIFSASASGTPKFTIGNSGALTDAAYTNAGGILYTSTTGLIGQTSAGSSSQCLLGGTTPTFGSCQTGGISNDVFWNQANGALFPNNSTVDLLVGGQSSTAAKFAILGVNNARGTQTASLSGSLVLDSSTASIQNTNNQTLTIGGNSTGNVNINPINGTGQTNINGTLDVSGHIAFGNTAAVDNTLEVINLTETINPSGDTRRGILDVMTSDTAFASGALYAAVTRGVGTQTGTSSWIAGLNSQGSMTGSGTVSDLIGNYATASVNNATTGTVTRAYGLRASISAVDGQIDTAYGIRVDSADNTGGVGVITTNYGIQVLPQTAGGTDYGIEIDAADTQTLWVSGNANNTTAAAGIAFGLSRDTNLYRSAADTLKTDDAFNVNGNFNVTSAGAISAATGITSSGNITFSTFSTNGGLLYTNGSGLLTQLTSQGSASDCLLSGGAGVAPSFGACPGGSSSNFWRISNGAISPYNDTLDLLIGSNASTSAKFAILGVNNARGTQTASLSGSISLDSSTASIQSTLNQSLTIGGDKTGNIILNPNNASGRVGINTSNPGAALDIAAAETTLRVGGSGLGVNQLGIQISQQNAGLAGGINIDFPYITGGYGLKIGSSGGGSGASAFTGNYILVNPTRQLNSNLVETDTGHFLNLTRANDINVAATSGVYNITGDLATLSSSCTESAGSNCVDTSNILRLTQSFGKASGAVLNIVNSGVGSAAAILSNSGGQSALIVNKTGNAGDILTASSSGTTKFALDLSGNIKLASGTTLDTLSSGTLGIGTTNATTLTLGRSGQSISLPGYNSAGGVLYSNSGTLAMTSAGTSSQCLLGGATPAFGSCGTGVTTDVFWNQANGALFPNNSTVDLLIGGQSTTSAKFAVTNINSGIPQASISGNLIVYPNDGNLGGNLGVGTTNPLTRLDIGINNLQNEVITVRSKLTSGLELLGDTDNGVASGGENGGAYVFLSMDGTTNQGILGLDQVQDKDARGNAYPGATGNGLLLGAYGNSVLQFGAGTAVRATLTTTGLFSIGASTPNAVLDVRGVNVNAGTIPAASISAQSSFAALVVDNAGVGDLFTASKSGATKFVINNAGNVTIANFTSNGGPIYANGSGQLAQVTAGTSSQCLLGGTTPVFGSCQTGFADPFWAQTNGALYPNNSTVDLLVGGQSSTAAKFAILGVNGARGTQTASLSGSISLDSSTASIQSTNNQTLTLGGNKTGNIILSPLNSGTGAKVLPGADNTVSLGATGSARFKDLFLGSSSLHVQCTTGDGCGQNLDYALGVNTTTNSFYLGANGTTGSPNQLLTVSEGGNVGIGTSTPQYKLDVAGATTSTDGDNLQKLTYIVNPTSDAFAAYNGTDSRVTSQGTSDVDVLRALNSIVQNSGSGLVNNIIGIAGQVDLEGAATNAFGISSIVSGDSGSATNVYGAYVDAAATATNSYGVYIKNDQLGSSLTYGVYQEDSGASNFFAGNLGLGTPSPVTKLHVDGTTTGKALVILNETGTDQNIISASASGTSVFTLARNGDVTAEGVLNINGVGVSNINGTLNLSGNNLSSSGILNIDTAGNSVLFANNDVLNVGGAGGVTFNSFADSLAGADVVGTDKDLYIEGILEVDGAVRFDNSSLTFSTFTSNGGILYTNGSGVLAQATAGTSSQCLLGGTTPTFGSCATGFSTSPYWNQSSGALFANNSTVDLLIGGQATTSAKFAVLGVNNARGTQTASVSGSLSLDSSTASIQTTNKQTLTIGGANTGNISIDSGSSLISLLDNVDLGNNLLLNIGDANTDFTAGGGLTLAGTLTANGVIALGDGGDNFSINSNAFDVSTGGAITGATGIASSGNITFSTFSTNGGLLYTNGSGLLTQLTSQGSTGNCLLSNGSAVAPSFGACTSSSVDAFWNQANGALYPNNSTVDLLIGGQSTTSAKFAVLNINDALVPVASISAGSGNVATYLTGNGTLGTTARGDLNIGTTTSGNVNLLGGNAGGLINITGGAGAIGGSLTLTGGVGSSGDGGSITLNGGSGSGSSGTINLGLANTASVTIGSRMIFSNVATDITTGTNQDFVISPSGTGKIGLFAATPLATLDVRANSGTIAVASVSGATSFAALTADNSGVGDLFAASSSGLNRFVITQVGNVGIGTTLPTEKLQVEGGNVLIGQKTNTSDVNNQSWTSVTGTAGTIGSNVTTGIASASAMAVYNGSMYVGTTKSNGAEVYRYDLTATSSAKWTKVSQTVSGTIRSGGTANIDGISAMTVYNGYLYIGTTESNSAQVYRYDGGTSWTLVSGTGQMDATTNIDSVSAMTVHAGRLLVGTTETTKAEVDQYVGGTTWTRWNSTVGTFAGTSALDGVTAMASYSNALYIGTFKGADQAQVYRANTISNWTLINSTAPGEFIHVNGIGTVILTIDKVQAMVVYNGALYLGLEDPNNGNLLQYSGQSGAGIDSWTEEFNAPGQVISGGTSNIDGVKSFTVYNGRLYIGTEESNSAEIYRWEGTSSISTKMSQTTAGTIAAGGSTGTDAIAAMTVYNNNVYASAYDSAEIYTQSTVLDQSYALEFHADTGGGGGIQNGLQNIGSISFLASPSGVLTPGNANTGEFLFSHGILTNASNYDIAEDYGTRDDNLEASDLVSIDPNEGQMVRKSSGKGDPLLLGVYSTSPALHLSQKDATVNGGRAIPIALAGRVPVKVTSENGNINSGDYLTASSIPGVAMKATDRGQVVGQAMEAYSSDDPTSIGKVVVYIAKTYYDPNVYLTDSGQLSVAPDVDNNFTVKRNDGTKVSGVAAFADGVFGKVKAGIITATTITTDSLNINTDQVKIGDKTLAEYISDNAGDGRNRVVAEQIASLQNQLASLSAVLGASTQSAELQTIQQRIDQKEQEIAQVATGSATVPAADNSSSSSVASGDGKFGKLRVTGSGLFEGMLTVLDNLTTQDIIVSGVANFLGDAVFSGNVTFNKPPTLPSSSAGYAVVKEGDSKIKVSFANEYDAAPLINATLIAEGSDSDKQALLKANYSYAVTDETTKGFTIILNKAAGSDIKFSWSAVQVSDARTSNNSN